MAFSRYLAQGFPPVSLRPRKDLPGLVVELVVHQQVCVVGSKPGIGGPLGDQGRHQRQRLPGVTEAVQQHGTSDADIDRRLRKSVDLLKRPAEMETGRIALPGLKQDLAIGRVHLVVGGRGVDHLGKVAAGEAGPATGVVVEPKPARGFRIARNLAHDPPIDRGQGDLAVNLEPLLGELPQAADIRLVLRTGGDNSADVVGALECDQRIDTDGNGLLGLGRRLRTKRGQGPIGHVEVEQMAGPGRALGRR